MENEQKGLESASKKREDKCLAEALKVSLMAPAMAVPLGPGNSGPPSKTRRDEKSEKPKKAKRQRELGWISN